MTSRRLLDPAAKVLLDAADYLETYGWWQGSYYDRNCLTTPPRCAKGAIIFSMGSHITKACVLDKFRHFIGTCDIPRWNDHPERTAAEVIAALRAAAIADPGNN